MSTFNLSRTLGKCCQVLTIDFFDTAEVINIFSSYLHTYNLQWDDDTNKLESQSWKLIKYIQATIIAQCTDSTQVT